ncbi:hypothetical protein [Altererythrobacter sp. ZODW24]|uniref:hypothetical protein n=1 Tax=Altererythrobacter sp. ZODW24 TaxID=2185142 RepID=UPI000DF784AC|nr:hypothetical protein [Altererythrobacter sp. ZODW24]
MSGQYVPRLSWEVAFLDALTQTKIIKRAAAEAGITTGAVYGLRNKSDAFVQECERALQADPAKQRAPSPTQWKRVFLETLAETSNVTAAAKQAGMSVREVYKVRRDDPEFAALWRRALFEGYEHLEMEVLAYLRGNLPDRKIDVPNAIRQLAAHRKTVAEMRAIDEDENEQDVLDSIDRVIDEMKAEWAAYDEAQSQNG